MPKANFEFWFEEGRNSATDGEWVVEGGCFEKSVLGRVQPPEFFPITIFRAKSGSRPPGAVYARVPEGTVSSAAKLIAKTLSTMRQSLQ
jgi:hypothetical protein